MLKKTYTIGLSIILLGGLVAQSAKHPKVRHQTVPVERSQSVAEDAPVYNPPTMEPQSPIEYNPTTIYTVQQVQVGPGFIGGFPRFIEYLQQNIYGYDKNCAVKKLDSTWIEMIIMSNGDIDKVSLQRSGGCSLLDEQILIYSKNKRWIPAQINGRFVNSRITLKIDGNRLLPITQKSMPQNKNTAIDQSEMESPEGNAQQIPEPEVDSIYKDQKVTHDFQKAVYSKNSMEWNRFLMENLQYPARCMENGMMGTLKIKFVVELDGSITQITFIEKIKDCPEFEKEILRVMKKSRPWIPATINDKPVRSFVEMPFRFQLD